MRRVVMVPVFLALLLAFFMAPYQHIHLATSHGGGADHDHGDTAVVHAHFDAESAPTSRNGEATLKDSDGDHASRPLDTFTTMPQAGSYEFLLPESRVPFFAPPDLFVGVIEVTEPCGHDPPFLEFSSPRGPPV
jgi:hypothetical protein